MLGRISKDKTTITIPLSHYYEIIDCLEMSQFKFCDAAMLGKRLGKVINDARKSEDKESERQKEPID